MKLSDLAVYFLLIFPVFKGFSQDMTAIQNPDEFIKKIKQASASTQTLKADFTEEKFVSYLKETQKSSGVFYYKKENKMRWEKSKPTPYILLIDGDKVKLKENGKEKDVSSFNAMIGKIKDLMITLVNGDFHKAKAFTPSYFQNNKFYIVRLVPKSRRLANVFDHIQLTISKDNMRLKEIIFMEKSGDRTEMKFFNDAINENISDKLFTNF